VTDEQKLKFTLHTEGRFFYKAQVFSFRIDGLQPKSNVGLTRDVLIPLFALIKKHFLFLDTETENPKVVSNFKGFGGANGREEILTVQGAIQEAPDPTKDEIDSIKFNKSLGSKFNKYQDGNILYDIDWIKSAGEDSLSEFSIEELLVGIYVFISSFRFALQGYAKTGFSYRFFNVPAQVFDLEVLMNSSFQINFKLQKGTPQNILNFINELLALIIEIFALEESIATQLLGIDEKLQNRLAPKS